VGQALMTALLDYADNWAQVLRIELTVFHDNQRAIRLYERHGFAPEGRLKAYALRNGVFEDVLAMARLHPKQPLVGASSLRARPAPRGHVEPIPLVAAEQQPGGVAQARMPRHCPCR
jgi:hypothetical protein